MNNSIRPKEVFPAYPAPTPIQIQNQFLSMAHALKTTHASVEIINDKNLSNDVNISDRYLNMDSKYAIIRKDTAVYAQEKESGNLVLMWHKSKIAASGQLHSNRIIGRGTNGIVYARGDTKAIKISRYIDLNYDEAEILNKKKRLLDINEQLLEMKFKLTNAGIDQHFIVGLHHRLKNVFVMPLIDRIDFNPDQEAQKQFTLALKKFNELGYFHPDLHSTMLHRSPQNLTFNAKGIIVTFDIDSSPLRRANTPHQKDQWIWHAIFDHANRQEKQYAIYNYYKEHPHQCISDDIEFLNKLNVLECYTEK